IELHLSAFRRPGHSAVIGAGNAGVGIAPADEVERVVDVSAELRPKFFSERDRLSQGNRLGFLCPAAHPVQSWGGIAELISRGSDKSACRREVAINRRVEGA